MSTERGFKKGHPKNLKRGPDGRFGSQHYMGPKPSENVNWNKAIKLFKGETEEDKPEGDEE